MKVDSFFELARDKGLHSSQIIIVRSKETDISLFNGSIEKYGASVDQTVIASGIYEGHFASVTTDHIEAKDFPTIVEKIIASAKMSGEESKLDLFEGSAKYTKKKVFNSQLASKKPQEAIAELQEMEKMTREKDNRVTDFMADYQYSETVKEFHNSKGVNLTAKKNVALYAIGAYALDGDSKKGESVYRWGCEMTNAPKKEMVNELVSGLFSQFGAAPCESGKYPTVLKNKVFSSFVSLMVSSTIAEDVQKKSSFLVGKLGQKVASSKVTIEERPLEKGPSYTYFDAEGVARYNKPIIKKGILQTYLYNRETALKDGVETTGNAAIGSSKMDTSWTALTVKSSKKSFEEMISPIKEGVYITSIQGLGTGTNANNGDFSCQASGFTIRDGKLAEPLTLITLAGNVLQMFEDIKDLDNRKGFLLNSIDCPDVYIKSMSIGGK